MADRTGIEWTDATWNPVRGCREVSPGCDHCYARVFAERFRGVKGHPYEAGFDPRFVPESLELPMRWTRPRRIFVNSMSDLFQGAISDEQIHRVYDVMRRCPRHVFQVLTKRAARRRKWYASAVEPPAHYGIFPLHNVWEGVSVESREYLPRIDDLRETPAAVRFLSLEPLLEDLGELDLRGIHWVIVGGESGRGFRELRPEWVRSLRDQCARAGVAFFFKQWGGLSAKRNGRLLDGRTHEAMPEQRP